MIKDISIKGRVLMLTLLPTSLLALVLGGYFTWVELPARIDTLRLHRAALDHGISIAPGPLFSSSGAFGNYLRLNCAKTIGAGFRYGAGYENLKVESASLLPARTRLVAAANANIPTEMAMQ